MNLPSTPKICLNKGGAETNRRTSKTPLFHFLPQIFDQMWSRWSKNSRRNSKTAAETPDVATTPPDLSQFSFSFKDVRSVMIEDGNPWWRTKSSPRPISTADTNDSNFSVRKYSSIFHRMRIASFALRSWKFTPASGGRDLRVVVYYTSLRIVRKTFEGCRAVRAILHGFHVAVDERDLAMDSAFLAELKGILGKKQLSLPQVFIGGRYVGGAEEVQRLHESGELKKLVEGIPADSVGTCDACGGVRFVLCCNCNGSRKYYHQERRAFRTCAACNENGLLRCQSCCRC